jgi:hypothetical protein
MASLQVVRNNEPDWVVAEIAPCCWLNTNHATGCQPVTPVKHHLPQVGIVVEPDGFAESVKPYVVGKLLQLFG